MTYPIGPGRRFSRGPVAEAYADVIDNPCPPEPLGGCGAKPGDWCTQPGESGPIPRHIPCRARYRTEGETS